MYIHVHVQSWWAFYCITTFKDWSANVLQSYKMSWPEDFVNHSALGVGTLCRICQPASPKPVEWCCTTLGKQNLIDLLTSTTLLCFFRVCYTENLNFKFYIYSVHVELAPRIALIHSAIHGCTCTPCAIDFSRGFWYGTLPCPFYVWGR